MSMLTIRPTFWTDKSAMLILSIRVPEIGFDQGGSYEARFYADDDMSPFAIEDLIMEKVRTGANTINVPVGMLIEGYRASVE